MPFSAVTSCSGAGMWVDEARESRVTIRPRLYAFELGVICSWASMADLTA